MPLIQIRNQFSKIWLRFSDSLQGKNCVIQGFTENTNGILYYRPLIYKHCCGWLCLWNCVMYQMYVGGNGGTEDYVTALTTSTGQPRLATCPFGVSAFVWQSYWCCLLSQKAHEDIITYRVYSPKKPCPPSIFAPWGTRKSGWEVFNNNEISPPQC